jgi:protoporphyrinogen oxidase
MSRLIQSAAHLLGTENIHTNALVDLIFEQPDGKVTLKTTGQHSGTFDKVFLAVPLAVLHRINVRPTWAFMKEQSICSMHFEPPYN